MDAGKSGKTIDHADSVHSPAHYVRGGMECKDVMAAMMDGERVSPIVGYWWGCALKYLWRWNDKNGMEDLEKARECIGLMIAQRERELMEGGRDGE